MYKFSLIRQSITNFINSILMQVLKRLKFKNTGKFKNKRNTFVIRNLENVLKLDKKYSFCVRT